MKILITGAAGFIGSNLVHWLINNTDHELLGMDNLSTGHLSNMPKHERFQFELADVRYVRGMEGVFQIFKPDVCYHCAAYASEGRSNYIRSFIHFNNTVGTANIINACVNHNCKLIFTSSVAVYSGEPPFSEITDPNPIDEYGLSKLMSEKSIEIAGREHGLEWCIIRPRNVFGERQSIWDASRNVAGIWTYQALHNIPMTIYGDGSNRRSFTYIESILPCLHEAINVKNEIINLGMGGSLSIKEFNDMFKKVTGYTNVFHLEPRHEVKEAYCNVKKSIQLLGFYPTRAVDMLERGISNMWSWAKLQPERELLIPPRLEIKKTNHSSII